MKKYILIFLISLFTSFGVVTFNYIDGFCAALPNYQLDQNSFEVLYGNGGAASQDYSFGINADPNLVCYGIDQIMNDVNNKLYEKYGVDLEDAAWALEDSFTSDTALYQSLLGGSSPSTDYMIWKRVGQEGIRYVMGKLGLNGDIIDLVHNSVVLISSNFLNQWADTKTELVSDGDIKDFTTQKIYFGTDFTFTSGWDFASYNLSFSKPVLLFDNNTTSGNGSHDISIVYPDNYSVTMTGFGIGTSGTKYDFNGFGVFDNHTFNVNGITYNSGRLEVIYGSNSRSLVSSLSPLALTEQNAYNLVQNGIYSGNFSYGYSNNDQSSIRQILGLLQNHWVTDDQLRQINEKIDGLSIGNISVNGDSNPIIDTDSDFLSELQTLIENIIDQNQDLDNELCVDPDPNPNPDPDPVYDNQGIAVIPDFPIPVINNLKSVLTLPLHVFSIFQPLFRVFGVYFSSLWGLWLFVPSCVLIGFLIWLIK